MIKLPDDRIPMAKAYQRASQAIGVAIAMLLPGLAGRFVDAQLGTKVVFTIIGFSLGLVYGIWRLVKLGQTNNNNEH